MVRSGVAAGLGRGRRYENEPVYTPSHLRGSLSWCGETCLRVDLGDVDPPLFLHHLASIPASLFLYMTAVIHKWPERNAHAGRT
jgi:hypothetical protein